MRVIQAIKRLCSQCMIVTRKNRLYVQCKLNPRHKQRQGKIIFASPDCGVAADGAGVSSTFGFGFGVLTMGLAKSRNSFSLA
ncbi:ribosomal protein L36, partial [Acrasis kona]